MDYCIMYIYLSHFCKYSLTKYEQTEAYTLLQLTENGEILHNFQLIWDTTDDFTRVTRLDICGTTTHVHPLQINEYQLTSFNIGLHVIIYTTISKGLSLIHI